MWNGEVEVVEVVAFILIVVTIAAPIYAIKYLIFGGKKKR